LQKVIRCQANHLLYFGKTLFRLAANAGHTRAMPSQIRPAAAGMVDDNYLGLLTTTMLAG